MSIRVCFCLSIRLSESISQQVHQLTPMDPRDGASRPVDRRAVYRAGLADDRRAVAKFFNSRVWNKVSVFQSKGPLFLEIP